MGDGVETTEVRENLLFGVRKQPGEARKVIFSTLTNRGKGLNKGTEGAQERTKP